MNARLSRIGLLLLAVAVPCAALIASPASPALAVSPFGWRHVALVHTLAMLPLACLVARTLLRRWPARGFKAAIAWSIIGFAAGWLSIELGATVGVWLDGQQAEFFPRALMRGFWCLALQLPWCLAALAMPVPDSQPLVAPGAVGSLLALAIALVLPAVYLTDFIDRQSDVALQQVQRGQLSAARTTITALADLGSSTPLGALTPAQARLAVADQIEQLTSEVASPLPADASAAARMERAVSLAALGQVAEARTVIEPLAQHDPDASGLVALLYQDDKQYAESTRWYQRTLALVENGSLERQRVVSISVRAYDGLAYNAREEAHYQQAEQLYLTAMERLPEAEAHFHFQLAQHYHLGGRPGRALEHFQQAAALDPQNFEAAVQAKITELKVHSPACTLSPQLPSSSMR